MRNKRLVSMVLVAWAMVPVFSVHCVGDSTIDNDAGKNDATTDSANDVVNRPTRASRSRSHRDTSPRIRATTFRSRINVNRAGGLQRSGELRRHHAARFTATQARTRWRVESVLHRDERGRGAATRHHRHRLEHVAGSKREARRPRRIAPRDRRRWVVTIPQFATTVDVRCGAAAAVRVRADATSKSMRARWRSGRLRVCDRSGHSGGTYTAFVGGGGAYAGTAKAWVAAVALLGFLRPRWRSGPVAGVAVAGRRLGERRRLRLGANGAQGGGESGGFGAINFCFAFPGAQDGGGWSPCGGEDGGYLHGGAAAYAGSNPADNPAAENGGAHAARAVVRILRWWPAAPTMQRNPTAADRAAAAVATIHSMGA